VLLVFEQRRNETIRSTRFTDVGGEGSGKAARMNSKVVSALIATLAFAANAEAQRTGADRVREPSNVIVDGQPPAGDRQVSPRRNQAVVTAAPTTRAAPTTQYGPGRNQAAPSLLDRNRSPSPD